MDFLDPNTRRDTYETDFISPLDNGLQRFDSFKSSGMELVKLLRVSYPTDCAKFATTIL